MHTRESIYTLTRPRPTNCMVLGCVSSALRPTPFPVAVAVADPAKVRVAAIHLQVGWTPSTFHWLRHRSPFSRGSPFVLPRKRNHSKQYSILSIVACENRSPLIATDVMNYLRKTLRTTDSVAPFRPFSIALRSGSGLV